MFMFPTKKKKRHRRDPYYAIVFNAKMSKLGDPKDIEKGLAN